MKRHSTRSSSLPSGLAHKLRTGDGMASEKTGSHRATAGARLLASRYRLVERIDEGGAGEVWRARDEKLDRDVAIKLLGPDADDAFRARFADEARRAAAVVHPNVVTVFDEGRDGRDAFMVMELVAGKTLRDLIAERGPLPAHEVSRLVTQVAAALDAAHAAGVIHCDLKPANVVLDPSGIAKLTDFGIARAARDPAEQELLGTARYIAPERVEGRGVTARSPCSRCSRSSWRRCSSSRPSRRGFLLSVSPPRRPGRRRTPRRTSSDNASRVGSTRCSRPATRACAGTSRKERVAPPAPSQ